MEILDKLKAIALQFENHEVAPMPVHPEDILDIAEAFREMERQRNDYRNKFLDTEQHAEAAEADNRNYSELLSYHIDRQAKAEAKLAELEKQEPFGMVVGKLGAGLRVQCYFMPGTINLGDELFTSAAPAVSPAELVPDGWQLVPVEPDWKMLSADGCKEHHNGQLCLHHDNRKRIWSAMLAAAPTPHD